MIVKYKVHNYDCKASIHNPDVLTEKIVDGIAYKKLVNVRKVNSGQHGVHVWTIDHNYFLKFYNVFDVRIEDENLCT